MKTMITILVGSFLLVACGNDKKAIEKAKFEEVMAIHDEVMPKMSNIRKLKKGLQQRLDSLSNADSVTLNPDQLNAMVAELESASESMMVWMRNFSEPEEGTPHEEVLEFYEEELVKVKNVKEKMLTAIEKAEELD